MGQSYFLQLGGASVFEPWLKAYIDHFKYQSIATDDFKRHLYQYFSAQPDKVTVTTASLQEVTSYQLYQVAALDAVDWHTWLHTPGMPPVKPLFVK